MASKTPKGKKSKQSKNSQSRSLSTRNHARRGAVLSGYPEVKLILVLTLCVFLMLCNFHLCSTLGDWIYSFLHGLFGVMAYLLPIGAFFAYAFMMANAGRKDARNKVIFSICLFLTIGSLCHLIGISKSSPFDLIAYYQAGQGGFNGGLLGGLFGGALQHSIGNIGGFLVVLALCAVWTVFITERHITEVTMKLFNQSKTSLQDKRQARLEQKEAKRLEQAEAQALMEAEAAQNAYYEEQSFPEDERPLSDYEESVEKETSYQTPDYSELTTRMPSKTFSVHLSDPSENTEEPVKAKERINRFIKTSLNLINPSEGEPDSMEIPEKEWPKEEAVSTEEKPAVNFFSYMRNRKSAKAPEILPNGLNGNDMVHNSRIVLDRDTQTLEEMGFELDALPFHSKAVGTPLSMDEFVYYNSIREWKESDPFVMPFLHEEQTPGKPVAVTPKPKLVETEGATVVDSALWQTERNPQGITKIGKCPHVVEPEDMEDFPAEVEEYEVADDFNAEDFLYEEDLDDSGIFAFPVAPEAEEAVDVTEHVVLPETDVSEEDIPVPASRKSKISEESIWRSKDDFENRSDSGAVTFSKPKPPEKKKEKVKKPYVPAPMNKLKQNGVFRLAIDRDQLETQKKLSQTLASFGVNVRMGAISVGPAVTRYELEPDVGVKVSRIVALQDDIKLALAAADVRIEAPIPGKSAVGIEVPNKANTIVGFRELIDTEKFKNHPSKLCVAIGRDLAGQIQLADLEKMPHLLIAGATGSGKSVCINTLIMSILYKATPDEVKLIMVDPKVVELSSYNGIPHLLIPVVTDPRKASNALRWAVEEMDDRYKRLAEYKVRNIKGYNEEIKKRKAEDPSFEGEPMYQMVIIVDELADLMMVASGEVEEAICRLAQKARAAGIHLVLATQRPSVNVITGLIKANVPSRIAFAVSSGVDSRTILDMNGAEKLLGKGDMLYYPYGLPKPIRIQGAFISDEEVADVVEYIVKHNSDKSGEEQMEEMITSAAEPEVKQITPDQDEHFAAAARFIIEKDKASIGALQREFRIGFNRAARLMDAMAEAGIVGEEEGTKPRKILMNLQELEAYLSNQ